MKIEDISTIWIAIKVNGDNVLFLMLASDGTVNRLGTGAANNAEKDMFIGKTTEPLFSQLRSRIGSEWLSQMGKGYSMPEMKGKACELVIGVLSKDNESSIAFKYGSESQGPPAEIVQFVKDAVGLTNPWYELQKSKVTSRDKVLGMFLGIFVGDALGFPVEGWSAERIAKEYGRLDKIVPPDKHKWFKGQPAGIYTDDTQLTLCVAEAIIENGFDMDTHAKWHVKSMEDTKVGWGRTTRRAIERMAQGISWKDAATLEPLEGGRKAGFGNGLPMKIAPAAAYIIADRLSLKTTWLSGVNFAANLSQMTHRTSMSASAAIAHLAATGCCLKCNPEQFTTKLFLQNIINGSRIGETIYPETLEDRITDRFGELDKPYAPEEIIAKFGGGCYVFDSLPFTYAFFLRNPHSFDSMIDCVNAGGDTDSNASMLGGLLGALHGQSIFPKEIVDSLNQDCLKKVMDTAERFCKKLEIS